MVFDLKFVGWRPEEENVQELSLKPSHAYLLHISLVNDGYLELVSRLTSLSSGYTVMRSRHISIIYQNSTRMLPSPHIRA